MPKNTEYESYVKIKDSKKSTLKKQQDGTFVLTIKKPTLEYNDQYKIKAKEYVNNEDYVNSHTLTSGTEKFKADSGKLITLNYEVNDATYDKKSKEMVCIIKPLSKKDEKKANEIVEAEDDSQDSGLSPEDLRVRADKEKFREVTTSPWFDKFHKKGLSSPAVISPGGDFRGKDLSDFDFRRAELKNADFRGSNLARANFLKADLRGADFRGAYLGGNIGDMNSKRKANFQHADLRGADLRGAGLLELDMSGSDLRDAKLKDAIIWQTTLNHANLSGLDLSLGSFEWTRQDRLPFFIREARGANFSEANLSGIEIENAPGANFHKADLEGTRLVGSNFQNANFYGANLKGALLTKSNLNGADFRAADLVLADTRSTSTRGTAWDSAICPNGLMTDSSPCLPLSEKYVPQ